MPKPSLPYRTFALLFIVVAALAFTPRYFLPLLADGAAFRTALHVHAITGTAWLGLFMLQAHLGRRGNWSAHKLVGSLSLAIAAPLFASGVLVTLQLFWRSADSNAGAYPVLLVNLSDMVLFALAYVAAILAPKDKAVHPPLMLLAAVIIMNAAVFRVLAFTIGGGGGGPIPVIGSHLVMVMLFVVILIAARRTLGRLDPRVAAVGVIAILVTVGRIPIGLSPLWQPIGNWVLGWAP